MTKRMNLFHNLTDAQLARLREIGEKYPDQMTGVGRGAGVSSAVRQAMLVLLAMSDAELDQHLGSGQFRPVSE